MEEISKEEIMMWAQILFIRIIYSKSYKRSFGTLIFIISKKQLFFVLCVVKLLLVEV